MAPYPTPASLVIPKRISLHPVPVFRYSLQHTFKALIKANLPTAAAKENYLQSDHLKAVMLKGNL